MSHIVSTVLGERELSVETGDLAKQAHGSALVRYLDSAVLVTVCSERKPRQDRGFLPLTCDYREYNYAAGKIPGGFFKREGRPTEKEILTSRLIDRPLRPLFPKYFRCETQIIAMVLSAEAELNPDVLAIVGASAALCVSDIPFDHTLAAVRIGLINDQFFINPTAAQLDKSLINLIVAGTEEAIVMVEGGTREIPEETVLEALDFAHRAIRQIIGILQELASLVKPTKRTLESPRFEPELERLVEESASEKILDAFHTPVKQTSEQKIADCREETVALIPEGEAEKRAQVSILFDRLQERMFRKELLEKRVRLDGRALNEIRPITSKVSLLPRTHGSALFTRGETQALVTATLGTDDDVQRLDDLTGESSKRFMLHYNFPPFSVGEVKFLRGPGRREIGHGVLAERAIAAVLPSGSEFLYTIRIVSDILESNGSSSMATVCGGIMALQDAGVPIRTSVAGIAMGLVKQADDYVILSDIAGFEDHYGDMDFKVAGTEVGITALQMDIKIAGVTREIMFEALKQAREGRLYILEKMSETISEPRPKMSEFAPRIFSLQIPVEKIGEVIGPGGKMIRSIIEQTGVKIDIKDDGTVKIFSMDSEAADKATKLIEEITATAEIGKTYMGKVTRIMDFGAFVQILPGTEGLLHISEIANRRIREVRDELEVGDKILVKVLNVDNNKIRLSRRAVLKEQQPTNQPWSPKA